MLRRLYEWILAKAADPRAEWWLAANAFVDGGLFPFPPHALFGLMCLAQPRRAVRYAIITTLASVAGGLLGYAIGHFVYATIGTRLLALLGLTAKFPVAACYLNEYGARIIALKGFTPIPFLLVTITAGFVGFPLWLFTAVSLASRGVIFLAIGTLFRVFGAPVKALIDRYFTLVCAGALVLILSGYFALSLLEHGTAHDRCDAVAMVQGTKG